MIPREVLEEIRYRCDIEDVVGSYFTLKRAGSNFNGLCPFHSEKTPSFTVFPATKSFYCFGCGAGGDVITFTQKIENLDYVGAVEALAKRAGIAIPNEVENTREGISRRRVLDINLEAAKFFRNCLFDPVVGKAGMEYLVTTRRLSGAVIRHFGLGFAPNDFGMLTAHLKKRGFSEEEMLAAFLCGRSKKTNRLFDLFRNRVIFPVIDTSGNVVAFGGRVMDDSTPKYLNSSDTPCFKKSRVLFGLNFAKAHAAEQMILCEGYMDTIAMHAAGFENAVATLGTAITPDHARLLSRYTKRVIINYDSDEAGQRAANKAMALLDAVGLEVRVLKLTGAKDADEYIRKFGADAFRGMLNESRTAFDHKLEALLSRLDVTTTEGKIRAAREVVEVVAAVPSGVERELYLSAASEKIGIAKEGLANDVARARRKFAAKAREERERENKNEAFFFGDRVNPDAAKNPAAARAEETVLGLLLLYPEYRAAVTDGRVPLDASDFATDLGRRAFAAIFDLEKSEGGFLFAALGETLSPDEMGRLEKAKQERQTLTNNGIDVLCAAADFLRGARQKREAAERGDWQSEIQRRRAEHTKKQENN